MKPSALRRGAQWAINLASHVLPSSHREWAHDMRAELDHVTSDAAALRWAIGCVTASIHQRVNAMMKLNGQISRPVLLLEWLMCFGPLTLLWFAAVRYIVTYDGASLDMFVATATGTLGPVALIASLAATLKGSYARVGLLAVSLSVAFALMLLLRFLDMGGEGRLNLAWFRFDWSLIVLISLLPLVGCLHLAHLSRSARSMPA